MFVSFNYRVGRFGTFAHPQLTQSNPDSGLLGNYGYLDQIAALRWIQNNIAAFGGDPDNVTLIGESAGGMSINTLITTPLAKGLFDRAVIMSGGNGSAEVTSDLNAVEKIGIDFAATKGITVDDPQALAKLRALSADKVTDGLNMRALFAPTPGPPTFARPFVDGKISVDAIAAYTSGNFEHVPIIIGATSADIGGPTGFMIAGARRVAAAVADHDVPTYYYRFSYVANSIGNTGAGHASDIPYFLDTTSVKYGDKTSPRDIAMSKTVSAYVINFAKTGNPNGIGMPNWPRYSRNDSKMMDFAEDGKAVPRRNPLAP
jgi:para-nitrobenzyl esterase